MSRPGPNVPIIPHGRCHVERTELVSRIAYGLFEHRGRGHGRDQDDWLLAEQLLESCLGATREPKEARARRPASVRPARELASASVEQRALALLETAADGSGRAAAAAALGYSSTSVVSALLLGRRSLDRALAERIVAAFGSGEVQVAVPARPGAEAVARAG